MNRPIIIDTVAGQAADIRRQHAVSSAAFAGEQAAAVTFLQQLIAACTPAYQALASRVAPHMPDAMPELRGVTLYGSEEPVLVGHDSAFRTSGDVGGSCLVWVHTEHFEPAGDDVLVGVTFSGRWSRDGGRTQVSVSATVKHQASGTQAIAEDLARKAVQVTQRLTELVDRVQQGNAQARADQAVELRKRLHGAALVLTDGAPVVVGYVDGGNAELYCLRHREHAGKTEPREVQPVLLTQTEWLSYTCDECHREQSKLGRTAPTLGQTIGWTA